jgi:hypothetical protein
VRVDQRPNAERGTPGARLAEVLCEHLACLLDRALGEVPTSGPQLGDRQVRQALRAPEILASLPVPLLFHRVAGSRLVEVVDRPEEDERERRLRRLRPGLHLQLPPLSEEVPAWAVSEPELGPEAIERDLGQSRRMTSWAQALHRGLGEGDRPGGIVGREADELGIDARGEVVVFGRSGQCSLEELPRAARPADPSDLREEVQSLRSECCHRRARLVLRDGPRALDVSGREQRGSLPQRAPGQLLQHSHRCESASRLE